MHAKDADGIVNDVDLSDPIYCFVHGVQHMFFFFGIFHQEIAVVNESVLHYTKNLFT